MNSSFGSNVVLPPYAIRVIINNNSLSGNLPTSLCQSILSSNAYVDLSYNSAIWTYNTACTSNNIYLANQQLQVIAANIVMTSMINIPTSMIAVNDKVDSPSNITFDLSSLSTFGILKLNGVNRTSFTMQNIINNQVSFTKFNSTLSGQYSIGLSVWDSKGAFISQYPLILDIGSTPSSVTTSSSSPLLAIYVGASVGAILLVLAILCSIFLVRRRRQQIFKKNLFSELTPIMLNETKNKIASRYAMFELSTNQFINGMTSMNQ